MHASFQERYITDQAYINASWGPPIRRGAAEKICSRSLIWCQSLLLAQANR